MTLEIFVLLTVLGALAAIALIRWFRTLDSAFFPAARLPLMAGVVAGLAIRFVDTTPWRFVMTGVLLTIAALYVRLMGEESEPADGMLLGAVTGATAALILIVNGQDIATRAAECLLAGSIAGYGITFAAFHVADRGRQIALDVATAVAALTMAWLPAGVLRHMSLEPKHVLIGAAAAAPLLGLFTVFRQWRNFRAELRHEASLGFIDEHDVRSTAHPFLRLGRAGWADPAAHREFVRLATRVAFRKRHQRDRQGEMARLYQLEIIKLRMQMQEMTNIDRASRAGHRAMGEERPSDTISGR